METLQTNNSQDMNTQVQTYLIEETMSLIYDNEKLDKWHNLVLELGLQGQTQIVKWDKSPIPFLHLKKGLYNIFDTLCPCHVEVEKYNITPIPVEILDLIALSKKEQYFSKIYIYYDDKKPDPACIGVVEKWIYHKVGTYNNVEEYSFTTKAQAEEHKLDNGLDYDIYHKSWDDVYYLIGRWADVKQSMDELKEQAKKRYIESESASLRQVIKKAQRDLDDIEVNAITKFN